MFKDSGIAGFLSLKVWIIYSHWTIKYTTSQHLTPIPIRTISDSECLKYLFEG